MTKKEFGVKKTALELKFKENIAALKEDYACKLSELTDETERINLTMAHRANLAKANADYQRELHELRAIDLKEAAEKEAAEKEAAEKEAAEKEAAEKEAKEAAEKEAAEKEAAEKEAAEKEAAEKEAVWPDGTYWSAMVTARRLLSRVHPRHGDGVSVSILWTKESGWFVNAAHTDDNGGLTRMFCNTYTREEMEVFQREYVASVNAWHEQPLQPMAKAFDNALNAVFGERKGGEQ